MNRKDLSDIDVEVNSDYILVKSDDPLKVLSSAVFNGGFCEGRYILNYRVEEDFDRSDPENFLREKVGELGLPLNSTVAMMTAADVNEAGITSAQKSNVKVKSITSAGVSSPVTIGATDTEPPVLGTVNTIVITNSNMSSRAMVDAMRIITEAKAVSFRELDIRDKGGKNTASGTLTDASVIAAKGSAGEPAEYAGPATILGEIIGRSCREAAKDALSSSGFQSGRHIKERLKERNLPFDKLVQTAEEAYVRHPDSEGERKITEILKDELERALGDINVSSLILSGFRLEEDGKNGLIPGLSRDMYESDPVHLLADEILGMRIANYINGAKAIFEFVRVDKSKPGVIGELGPFSDDIIGGLIAGVCSRSYERGR